MREPARVFLNGRFLTQGTTGVQRHAREVVRELDRLLSRIPTSADQPWMLLTPRGASMDFPLTNIQRRTVGRLTGHLWEQLELPRHAAAGILLGFANSGPIRHPRQVVTIHDAAVFAVPEAFSPRFGRWYRFLLPRLARRARLVLTVSEFSASELVQRAGVARTKLRVVPPGSEHLHLIEADRSILDRFSLIGQPFVLAVGSQSPHKNLARLMEAVGPLSDRGYRIVVAGGVNPRIFGGMTMGPDAFTAVGYVTDGELRALYEAASCLVFPSLYEGFGHPPLEAMSLGCPVVASSAASIREVCGDAAVYCDPHQPEDIRRAILEVINAPERGAELRRRGAARAAMFSWKRTARQIFEMVEELIVDTSATIHSSIAAGPQSFFSPEANID
ncbi:MAG TPA: glycosyltransferase family 1 protein [Gemmatimonadaceae bacterium]|nr:glycosyltransferase family 1 protein [Gemmatimonadaceae bacterium]